MDGYAVAKIHVQVQFRVVFSATFVSQRPIKPCSRGGNGSGQGTGTGGECTPGGEWNGPVHIDRATTYGDCPCNSRRADRAMCMCRMCSAFRELKQSSLNILSCDS